MPTALRACFQAWRIWRSGITAVRRNSYGQPRLDLYQTRRLRRVPEWASIPGGFDMRPETFLRAIIRAMLVGATMAVLPLAAASAGPAGDAANILKSSTRYLGRHKEPSPPFDSDIERLYPQMPKNPISSPRHA